MNKLTLNHVYVQDDCYGNRAVVWCVMREVLTPIDGIRETGYVTCLGCIRDLERYPRANIRWTNLVIGHE